ncbi:unnamed protein product [Polarella glacialis]|uniref:Uncharacterized protein n=1 Tax=Polarella glacialis TaxID=89957 RepID=A0A813G1Y0_POLGL|nr:unnamed protein product [Polarella glacialis]
MGGAAEPPAWLDPQCLYDKQTVLLGLLQATLARLEQACVPCWITGGTLLGALRHGGSGMLRSRPSQNRGCIRWPPILGLPARGSLELHACCSCWHQGIPCFAI